ncbi:Transposon Ty3-I Gag-Pol poly, partial [Brachionus plicatilis]
MVRVRKPTDLQEGLRFAEICEVDKGNKKKEQLFVNEIKSEKHDSEGGDKQRTNQSTSKADTKKNNDSKNLKNNLSTIYHKINKQLFFDPVLFHEPFTRIIQSSPLGKTKEINIHKFITLELNSSNLIKISAKIFGINVSNVLDTGASRSMIKKECLNKILEIAEPGSIKFSKLRSPLKIKLGDTSLTESNFKVKLDIDIEGDFYPLELLVLETLPYDVLFGMDFITLYDVLIRPATKTIKIDPDFVQTKHNCEIPENYLICSENVFIPPFCEVLVPAIVNKIHKGQSLVTSYCPLVERFGIYAGKGVLSDESEVSICLANLTKETVCLPKRT